MSFFGEIVEPGTRTAWEDWDTNLQEDDQPKLLWCKEATVPPEIKRFFIIEGRYIADSVQSLTKYKLELVNIIQPVNIHLYRVECAETYICVLKDYDLLLASEIVDLLKLYINVSNDLIAILTKPIAEYQATEYQEYVIRCVSTTKPPPLPLVKAIPKLEQPNIISGVTAGAICLREMKNESGVAVIFYMEHNEEYQIDELQELLGTLDFGPVDSLPNNSFLKSNLYI